MTGIDSTLASVLASRIDLMIDGIAAGARTAAAQTGASTQTADMRSALGGAIPAVDPTPVPSALATLSEVGLTLDAISRFGGEATPAVLGEAPIWPAPPAIDAPAQPPATASGAGAGAATNGAAPPRSQAGAGQASAANETVATSATLPVAALAAALRQTVAGTGLFYESHLAQWLAGAYPASALAEEPQTRLAAQLSLDLGDGGDAGAATDALFGRPFGASTVPGAPVPPHAAAAQVLASALAAYARKDAAAYANAWQVPSLAGQDTAPETARSQAGQAGLGAQAAETLPGAPASIAASIHPATIPLVRQQLDLLATEQFRFNGEIWPGAKLDWMIEPEREHRSRQDEHEGAPEQAWRTRLTLALPSLGTVDADLMLRGTQLVVRVQASPGGAARLATGGDAFGRRLRAAGIELAGLSIREIGGAPPGTGGASGAGTFAYARAATEAADAQAREVPTRGDNVSDVGLAAARADAPAEAEKQSGQKSPLDRLFDDPFDWSAA